MMLQTGSRVAANSHACWLQHRPGMLTTAKLCSTFPCQTSPAPWQAARCKDRAKAGSYLRSLLTNKRSPFALSYVNSRL